VLGCTKEVASPSDLRGWPAVQVRASELRPCADGG
jgi:hypothetical protein